MKKVNNSVTLILMFSSIALLLVLQFLWIRSSYTDAYDNLRKLTDNTFRNAVFTLRDSIMQKTFESLSPDSVMSVMVRRHTIPDTFRTDEGPLEIEAGRHIVFHTGKPGTKGEIKVMGFARSDKFDSTRRKFSGKVADMRDRRDFFFRFAPDSIKMDTLTLEVRKALDQAGIGLPFKIVHSRRGDRRKLPGNVLFSEPVRISPFSRYSLMVYQVRGKILRDILPQAMFSAFLTLLTIASFYVLYRSIRSQQKLVQLKNDFISNITHELKTPITTVSVAIEALRNFKGLNNPALTEEYLGIAQNELGRLSILTDKVLKTAIYEDKGISFTLERIDLEQLAAQVIASLRLVFEKSGTAVTFTKTGKDFVVSGDRDHLINVVYNLLDNAVKYSPSPAMLTVSVNEQGGDVILSIGDNGPGIAPEYRKKIFEKFFRVPTGDVHNIKGYGLGLSYVLSVVKSHLGTIEVTANGERGSCFMITLPKA